jgi:hypothetical protein
MSESDLAIVAALVFAWGTVSARLERFDVTAPIIFVLAGVLLTADDRPGRAAGAGPVRRDEHLAGAAGRRGAGAH